MIAAPPLLAGAVKATLACVLPGVTEVMLGAPATAATLCSVRAKGALVNGTTSVTVMLRLAKATVLGVPAMFPVAAANVAQAGKTPVKA